MATHRVPIVTWASIPDTGGEVFFEPFSIKAVNDQWNRLVLIFNDTSTRKGIDLGFHVPKNYVGTANLIIVWTANATTGDVEWDFDYRAVGGDDAESLDQVGTQESVNGEDTAPTAAFNKLEKSLPLTDGNFAIDDQITAQLFRDGTDAGDTMAAAAIVFDVFFEYSDT